MAFYKNLEPVSRQLTIVVGLTVVGFMAFGLTLSFYRNVLFQDMLDAMSAENEELRREVARGYGDLDYYRSELYKDKYAKQNLGRINPGEKMIIIASNQAAPSLTGDAPPTERQRAEYEELLRQMPIIQHWKLYLFRRDTVERMKRGL